MAQFTPQEFLATYLAQNNIAALSPREQYIVLGRLQQVLDASAATGTEPTPQRLAVALAGSETIRAQTGINDSQSESLIAALIVSADDTVTYIEENGSVEPPVDPVDPDTPADFTLTKANDKEIFNGTAKSEVFDAMELGSLQNDDIIMDVSTTDNDVLNALVNNSTTKARIQNIETLNFTGQFVEVGFDLVNTLGAQTLNLSTKIAGGTASVTNANSINLGKIVAGNNIATLNVGSLASGTRDTVTVDAGAASTVTITGTGAGVDDYNVKVAADTTVTATTYSSAGDKLYLDLAGGKNNKLVTGAAGDNQELVLTLNASNEDVVLELNNTSGSTGRDAAKSIEITGSKNVTIKTDDGMSLVGDGAVGSGNESITNSGNGKVTIELTGTSFSGSGYNYETADVDYIELGKTSQLSGDATVTINENATLRLAGDLAGSGLTVQVDNGHRDTTKKLGSGTGATDGATATAMVELAQTNSGELKTGDKVKTLYLTAKHDEDKDLDQDANGKNESHLKLGKITTDEATTAIVLAGAEKLEVDTVKFDGTGKYALSASNLAGDLTIGTGALNASGASGEISLESAQGKTTATLGIGKFDVRLNGTSSDIKLGSAGDGTKVTATGGKNTIDAGTGSGKFTITLADGDDTVKAAKENTITLGGGNDIVEIGATGRTDHTTVVKDFVKGTDTLLLKGTGSGNVDVTKVNYNTTNGRLEVGAASSGDWAITLENGGTKLTDKDLRDSIRLEINAATGSTITAGDQVDKIIVGSGSMGTSGGVTITTGGGNDEVTLTLAQGSGSGAEATIKDFTKGADKIVLVGAIEAQVSVDLSNVTRDGSGQYTIGTAGSGAAVFKLENDGNDVSTSNNLADIVQLGTKASGGTFDVEHSGASTDVTVTGGKFDDFVKLTGSGIAANQKAIFNFSNDGGVDTVVFAGGTGGSGKEQANFNLLDGINTTTGGKSLVKTTKVGDATDKGVYIFESSAAGVGGAKINTMVEHVANGYTKEAINAEVAAFINAGLGTSDGETYVVIINDKSTDTYKNAGKGGTAVNYNYDAYAYLVQGNTAGVTAADIKLIGMLDDGNGTAAGGFTVDQIV